MFAHYFCTVKTKCKFKIYKIIQNIPSETPFAYMLLCIYVCKLVLIILLCK